MKKISIILLVTILCVSIIQTTQPTFAKTKYVKIKSTTIKNYKKQIKNLKTQITTLKKEQQPLKEEAEKWKGITTWLYDTLVNKCGYKYDKSTKTWSTTGYESIECFDCHKKFAHQPKGTPKYKYCPNCGSTNIDN